RRLCVRVRCLHCYGSAAAASSSVSVPKSDRSLSLVRALSLSLSLGKSDQTGGTEQTMSCKKTKKLSRNAIVFLLNFYLLIYYCYNQRVSTLRNYVKIIH